MSRVLLLCFVHGFKGGEDTFYNFPNDLKKAVAGQLPDHQVESVVYPKYETKGELAEASADFLEWLKERVLDVRKAHFEHPWPPNDRNVGVILLAHSMGGFVAADALFLALDERASSHAEKEEPIFPLIQGILTFDTPYNGLARSMFVYGAFSNYQKVNGVFNAMTALSAAAPAGLARLGSRRAAAATASAATPSSRSSPAWTTWQLLAVRTGTVGAIAAGGVAAYVHREAIMEGVRKVKNLNKESIAEGYHQGLDTLGQGLAYINRGSVGRSFAWLSDHFTFVGALMRQKELHRRLERMGSLQGVGMCDFYCSLGKNGYWSGGYFVPERTFCAVPEESHAAYGIFSRWLMPGFADEVQAHLDLFRPEKHSGYGEMTDKSAGLLREWFLSEAQAVDDPRFRQIQPDEAAEDAVVDEVLGKKEERDEEAEHVQEDEGEGEKLPDASPIDIAAAASLVPLPEDKNDVLIGDASTDDGGSEEKRTYTQYLFQIAQQAGTGVKDWWPDKVPQMPNMPSMTMPKFPASMSSLGQAVIPGTNLFSRKKTTGDNHEPGDGQTPENDGTAAAKEEEGKE